MKDTIALYPSPGRGHLVSMVELGKLIVKYHPSFAITVIIPSIPTETTTSNHYTEAVTAANPNITFLCLPAISLPMLVTDDDVVASLFEQPRLNNPNLHKTLINLSMSCNLRAFIIDFFCSAADEVSDSLNIPTYYYYTSGASGLCMFLYFPTIDKIIATKGLRDRDFDIEIPGIPPLPITYLPESVQKGSGKAHQCFIDTSIQMAKSAGIIVNTFESLEPRAVKALLDGQCVPNVPPLYFIGPVTATDESKEKHECLSWLGSQPSRSVVFLCFGSVGVFSAKQLKEMAIGLERSGVRFLWVVRNPPPEEHIRAFPPTEPNLDSILPEGFLERTKERGLVVKVWAPQVEVLNHDSVGGFVSHCGWNSTLEAVCAGVPMLTWPLYAEQHVNGHVLVEEIKVALPVTEAEDGLVSASELEKRVTELMDPEKGKAVRERVLTLKTDAVSAHGEDGSSRVALAKLISGLFKQN